MSFRNYLIDQAKQYEARAERQNKLAGKGGVYWRYKDEARRAKELIKKFDEFEAKGKESKHDR